MFVGYFGISLLGAWVAGSLGVPTWASLLAGFLFLPALALALVGVAFAACGIDDRCRRIRAAAVLRRMRRLDGWEAPEEMFEEELNRLRNLDSGNIDRLIPPIRAMLLAGGKSREYLLRYLAARREVPAIRALIGEIGMIWNDPVGGRARSILRR